MSFTNRLELSVGNEVLRPNEDRRLVAAVPLRDRMVRKTAKYWLANVSSTEAMFFLPSFLAWCWIHHLQEIMMLVIEYWVQIVAIQQKDLRGGMVRGHESQHFVAECTMFALEPPVFPSACCLHLLLYSQCRWLQLKLWILMWVRLAWIHRTTALTPVMALPLLTLKDQTWMQRECSLLW